jgi:hypothetical protein
MKSPLLQKCCEECYEFVRLFGVFCIGRLFMRNEEVREKRHAISRFFSNIFCSWFFLFIFFSHHLPCHETKQELQMYIANNIYKI